MNYILRGALSCGLRPKNSARKKQQRRRSKMQMRFNGAAPKRCRFRTYLNSRSHLFKLSFLSLFDGDLSALAQTILAEETKEQEQSEEMYASPDAIISWNLCKFNVLSSRIAQKSCELR